MELEELKKKQVVSGNGHFMPLVFSDIVISAKCITVGAVLAGREISKQIKDNKFSIPQVFRDLSAYTPVSAETEDIERLSLSLDDIMY